MVPSGVRTTLMGQQDSEYAMPLDEFLTETMTLLGNQPEAKEIVVESARSARHAVVDGTYDQVLTMLSNVKA